MGTRSKIKARFQGAFGQSPGQKIERHNECIARIKVIQAILEVDKGLGKKERQRLEIQLKELIQQCG